MSADRWSCCPACSSRACEAYDAAAAEVDALYGQVPVAEFDVARAALGPPPDAHAFETFREDYEFYGAEEGVVRYTYRGYCFACNLLAEFSGAHPFWPEVSS